jgi:hypothetical protein
MMTRVKLGMALAVGLGMSLGGPASAATVNNGVLPSVTALNDVLGLVVGSTGNQILGGNPELPCPGGVEGGDEDIYDFNQDGIPDYAQMALIEALYNSGNAQVVTGLNNMAVGLKVTPITVPPGVLGPEDCLDAFCGDLLAGLINGLNMATPALLAFALPLLDDNPFEGLSEAEVAAITDQAIDALIFWGAIDNPGNLLATACIDELVGLIVGILTNLYDTNLADMSGLVNASVVLPDGETVLDKWLQASGGKTAATDDPAFLASVQVFIALYFEAIDQTPPLQGGADNPFPPAPTGTPVAAPLGLALLAAGIGFAAVRRSRRA